MEPKKRDPKPEDREVAKLEHDADFGPGVWDALPLRTQNRLAREQMYHREFAELSKAIMRTTR